MKYWLHTYTQRYYQHASVSPGGPYNDANTMSPGQFLAHLLSLKECESKLLFSVQITKREHDTLKDLI